MSRRKKDVIAAGADSDQEEWVEEAFQKEHQPQTTQNVLNSPPGQEGDEVYLELSPEEQKKRQQQTEFAKEKIRKKRVFYYYALQFKYKFEFDEDTVYFSFAKPITYTEILTDLH